MVALSITASQVQPGSGVATKEGTAGATITAGQCLYLDSATDTLKLADANGTAAVATCVGIALNGASSGQPVEYQSVGSITLGAGASMTVGEIYLVSTTAGSIMPEADISTQNDYVTVLGVATAAATLKLSINVSGAQIP